jgi:DNA end-binding protein Ku
MARSIWKGSIGFGLVNIGVELLPMEAPERIDFDLLDKRDMAPIGYRKVNKATGEEVEKDDIVRGFRIEGDRYVVLSDEDIAEANPQATKSVELIGFVPRDAVPLPYFAKPYLLAPTKGSEKAYRLLRDALEDTERLALGEIVVRTRQYTCAVYPHESLLVVHLLRYDEELRKPSDLGVSAPSSRLKPEEVKLARTLIASMDAEWDATAHRDTFRREMLALIRRRAKQGTRKVKAAPGRAAEEEPKVLDLVAALKRSVNPKGGARGSKRAARPKAARSSRRTATKRSA